MKIKVLATFMLCVALVADVGVSTAASAGPASPAAPETINLTNGDGITVLAAHWVDPRLLDITVSSTALTKPAGIRVLVPANYASDTSTHYPVLYLLHGGGGSYTDWTTFLQAEPLTASLPLISVMPDGGGGGWYSNAVSNGQDTQPEWETFHINQLIPWIDANFRTIADRQGRAIAGLSMGGFGALSYAARHPDLFAASAAFSGAVDSNNPGLRYLIYLSPIIDGLTPGGIYGTSQIDNTIAEAHNPYNLAANLRGMHIALYAGDGYPGVLDPPGAAGYDYQEYEVHEMSLSLSQRLTRLGIPHTFDNYGGGTHTPAYWDRDLSQELPAIMSTLAPPTTSGTVPLDARGTDHDAATDPTGAVPPTTTPVPSTTGVPVALPGSTLYVSTSGADNASCAPATPCRTIGHASAVAASGDTIDVGPGTFTGNVTIAGTLTVRGTAGHTVVTGDPSSTAATIAVATVGTATLDGLIVENANMVADGIANRGTLTVIDSTLTDNGGSGLSNFAGTATVENSTLSDNGSYGASNQGTIDVENSIVKGNDYGIANNQVGTVTDTTVSGNDGAGVVNGFGTTTLERSTVADNLGAGVQAFSAATNILDSTITGNQFYGVATAPTPYASAPVVNISDSTITDNTPNGLNGNSPITEAGSIVAANTAGDCSGSVTDAGYNLSSDASCPSLALGSIRSTDPGLGNLQDNGGPTMTQTPGSESRAVGAIPNGATASLGGQSVALCAGTTDQRGLTRPQAGTSGKCDEGSVELAPSASVLNASPSSAVTGHPVTFTAAITSGVTGLPAPAGTVVFSDDGTLITGCEHVAVVLRSNGGRATCQSTASPTGGNPITAIYHGTNGYLSSIGTLVYVVPPITSVGLPADNSTLIGSVWLDASAYSPVGLRSLQYLLSGTSFTDKVIASGTFTVVGTIAGFDTTSVPNGHYMLQSKATDSRGTSTISAPIAVTVDNRRLTTEVLIPSSGASVSNGSFLVAGATGRSPVTAVTFEIRGNGFDHHRHHQWKTVGTATPTLYGWIAAMDTKEVPSGSYRLRSVATDRGGERAVSHSIRVAVTS